MRTKRILATIIAFVFVMSISAGAISSVNANGAAILHPGYITGTLTVTGKTVTGGYVRAVDTTLTYEAIDSSAPGGVYSLTVEGGYTYNVRARADMAISPGRLDYLDLGKQTITVNVLETVTLNFDVDPGYIAGTITLDPPTATLGSYTLYAEYTDPSGELYRAISQYPADPGATSVSFNFPMVPGANVAVYGYAFVDGVQYNLERRTGLTVTAGFTTTVDYILTPGTATISVTVQIVGQTLINAYIGASSPGPPYKYVSKTITSWGTYSLTVTPGCWTVYVAIYMDGGWNFLQTEMKTVTLNEGETAPVDFTYTPGFVTGQVILSGANTELYQAHIRAYRSAPYQYAETSTPIAHPNDYRLILTPGTWEIGKWYNYLYFTYPSDPDPSLYSYILIQDPAQAVQASVVAEETVSNVNFAYGTATITTYFYVEGGGKLSYPRILGTCSVPPAYAVGSGSWSETTEGRATVTLVPGTYNLEFWAYVPNYIIGSNTKFGKLTVTVEVGDVVVYEIGAPSLVVTEPLGEETFTESPISVAGKADDDNGVASVTVNGVSVPLTSTDDPAKPNEVSFSTTVDLVPGTNSIVVVATNIYGKKTSLTRTVTYSPPTPPTGYVSGTILDDATGQPLTGISFSINVYDAEGTLLATTTTTDGTYTIEVAPGIGHRVELVCPTGYVAIDSPKIVDVTSGVTTAGVDFHVFSEVTSVNVRSMGYWKQEVAKLITGKGKPDYTKDQMLLFLDVIKAGWNAYGDVDRSLEGMYSVLCPQEPATMQQRAKQQLFALLLNVVSGKIGWLNTIDLTTTDLPTMHPEVIYWPGSVGNAITFCTSNLDTNPELAKDVADTLNNGIGYI